MARVDSSVSCLASIRRLVLFVLFFFLIVIGAGGGEGDGAGDDEGVPFYLARFLLFAVSVLMFAMVIASMMRMREGTRRLAMTMVRMRREAGVRRSSETNK